MTQKLNEMGMRVAQMEQDAAARKNLARSVHLGTAQDIYTALVRDAYANGQRKAQEKAEAIPGSEPESFAIDFGPLVELSKHAANVFLIGMGLIKPPPAPEEKQSPIVGADG